MPRPHHPNEALNNKPSLKKLPEKLESTSIAFPAILHNLPVVVLFEDEARFGTLSREMACWFKGKTVSCVAKQLIREYIYAYSALSTSNG